MFLFGLILGLVIGGIGIALVFRKNNAKATLIINELVEKVQSSKAIISKSEIEAFIEKHK
jgi:hypothetical protein